VAICPGKTFFGVPWSLENNFGMSSRNRLQSIAFTLFKFITQNSLILGAVGI
jgi:hypothetical protein